MKITNDGNMAITKNLPYPALLGLGCEPRSSLITTTTGQVGCIESDCDLRYNS